MNVGVAYYPEHWDPERWALDVSLMKEAGISVVRLAEFAWCRLEPAEGVYDFAWLDRAVALFEAAGIRVVLGTPTAAPPAWLHERFPDLYPMDNRRYRLGFGTRLQRCLNHPAMRDYGRRITRELAAHYGTHPNVAGWQIDNEFTWNECYCPVCETAFQNHLRKKFGTLRALNEAWGTVFWSQVYSRWEQIPLPWEVKCGTAHNPSLQLDFRRFQSEATLVFQQEQVNILHAFCPGQFVTHNFMGQHASMDYTALAQPLDFVAWDNYPATPWRADAFDAGFSADIMWGLKRQNVWVMEQQNGITGWETMSRRIPDKQLRCWGWQAIAHGADTVLFFRWRTCRFGTEQFWHGVLNHDAKPRRRYREVQRFAREVAELSDALGGSEPCGEVAILNGYDQHFALQIQPQAAGLGYWDQAKRYYNAFRGWGLNVEIVPASATLNRYRVIVLPSWMVLTVLDAERLTAFVREGGHLIISPRTGVKDENNVCVENALPGLLGGAAGLEVDDYDPLGTAEVEVRSHQGQRFKVSVWAESLVLDGAEATAWYASGPFAGEPAVARHTLGQGTIWYFGTYGDAAFYRHVLRSVLNEAHVVNLLELPAGMDATWRVKEDARILFLTNLTDETVQVNLERGLTPLMGPPCEEGRVALGPFDVAIFATQGAESGDGNERAAAAWAPEVATKR